MEAVNEPISAGQNVAKRGKPKIAIGVVVAIVFVAFILIFVLHQSNTTTQNNVPTTIAPKSSTIPPSQNTSAVSKTSNYSVLRRLVNNISFSPDGLVSNATILFQPSSEANCSSLEVAKSYVQNAYLLNNTGFNYSLLNKSKPIGVEVGIILINPSEVKNYTSRFYKNGGFCESSYINLFENSSTSAVTYNASGTTVYLDTARNPNSKGLYYIGGYNGNRPNVTLYYASALYKGYVVRVFTAQFTNSTEGGMLYNYTRNLTNRTLATFGEYLRGNVSVVN
jgi:hypothetical protein